MGCGLAGGQPPKIRTAQAEELGFDTVGKRTTKQAQQTSPFAFNQPAAACAPVPLRRHTLAILGL